MIGGKIGIVDDKALAPINGSITHGCALTCNKDCVVA